jgi:uncharacterized membrane protein YqjE
MSESTISLKIALQVWWAQMWRLWALGIAAGAFIDIFFNSLSTGAMPAAALVLVIVGGIWATRRSLESHYSKFRITITETAKQKQNSFDLENSADG